MAEAAETARIFTSSPMWNITQPGQEHGREREADGERGKPCDLQANGRHRAECHRQEEADAERRNGDDDRVPDHGTSL